MASASIQLTDGDGIITGVATASFEGDGDGTAVFTADLDEGLDREGSVTFRTTTGSPAVSVTRKVTQEGMREKFNASDGEFWVKNEEDEYDGGTFHVLKGFSYEAGDILFYNEELDLKVIIPYETWSRNKSGYTLSGYIPVGVVAIPSSHDVYGTGECAVISIVPMSCETPEQGATSETNIYYGDNNKVVGKAYPCVVYCGFTDAPTTEITGVRDGSGCLPSDNFSETKCPTDPEASYNYSSSTTYAIPSPYLEDGSRNPNHYATEPPSSEENGLSDFDGKGNTDLMVEATTEDWESGTIHNSYSRSGYFSCALCCRRFCPDGTDAGDWYMPSLGEMSYVIARLKRINGVIDEINGVYGIGVPLATGSDDIYWTATTERTGWYISRGVWTYYGNLTNYYDHAHAYHVRAFLRF